MSPTAGRQSGGLVQPCCQGDHSSGDGPRTVAASGQLGSVARHQTSQSDKVWGQETPDVTLEGLCRSTNAIRSSSSLTEVLVKHATQTIPAQYQSCLRGPGRCLLPRPALAQSLVRPGFLVVLDELRQHEQRQPNFRSSPWIRRYPHLGFSRARRTIRSWRSALWPGRPCRGRRA
jgi:hypothetical protein